MVGDSNAIPQEDSTFIVITLSKVKFLAMIVLAVLTVLRVIHAAWTAFLLLQFIFIISCSLETNKEIVKSKESPSFIEKIVRFFKVCKICCDVFSDAAVFLVTIILLSPFAP